ncbi:cell division cycle-associated protein 3 isoform X2 [Dunckerocampus dactyliophorus]|uniref:cell division cycle-associated protein 3 isoform X2 n=1 Tax=Dunckerocampus dactyliophorus TaxID=161453 RepID=UPI002405E827|nr:cell division cycle-associated protein 3 isoform X2 [Dunckerocampus dactyliophorus]
MGSSESKMTVCAAPKPEASIKNAQVAHLVDPRSPSLAIDRTPIQVGGLMVTNEECPLGTSDPRSPTVGITRTPVREVMRAKVGSFTRRLGMLFHMEAEGKVPQHGSSNTVQEEKEVNKSQEMDSTKPLLSPPRPRTFGSLAAHANLLATPIHSMSASSPFVLLEEPQVEVEIEADVSLEEAEEARESPLHKRLSMSLITYHEGATAAQVFAEVHRESPASSHHVAESVTQGVDHLYALPTVTLDNSPDCVTSGEPSEESSVALSLEPPQQPPVGVHRLTFDPKSPSQLVFKPQWLGKGFGATGLRARAVQGRKGGSSPLAVSVSVKNINKENKGHSGKQKQKGTEGRSPLQILNETNSPRGRPQMKQKVSSTPEKPRPAQMDRRVLALSLDKENR